MEQIKIKTNAKVNFTLDILGKRNGYHEIKSLVATINLYDEITLKARQDNKIVLTVIGDAGCSNNYNNAYKTAKLFQETFNTCGIDILLKKQIPLSSGLGGSSADVSGVLRGLKLLLGIDCDISPLASKIDSDSTYMLRGGFAVMSGLGGKVKYLDVNSKFYILVCLSKQKVSSLNAYKKYDEQNVVFAEKTSMAEKHLIMGNFEKFCDDLKNDLFFASKSIAPEIGTNYEILKQYAPTVMSGSGSAVFSVFKTPQEMYKVYMNLASKYGMQNKLIKTETV